VPHDDWRLAVPAEVALEVLGPDKAGLVLDGGLAVGSSAWTEVREHIESLSQLPADGGESELPARLPTVSDDAELPARLPLARADNELPARLPTAGGDDGPTPPFAAIICLLAGLALHGLSRFSLRNRPTSTQRSK
jgi:hypothetical protein